MYCSNAGPLRTLLISLAAICLLSAAPSAPTAAQARDFMDKAETELLQLSSRAQQPAWVEQTFITGGYRGDGRARE